MVKLLKICYLSYVRRIGNYLGTLNFIYYRSVKTKSYSSITVIIPPEMKIRGILRSLGLWVCLSSALPFYCHVGLEMSHNCCP